MATNLSDPRVRKTRQGFREAFFVLLERQGYDSITIQDIANEADSARITFYRHYQDKEELLADCLHSLFSNILQRFSLQEKIDPINSKEPTRIFFEHLQENQKLYKILLSSRGGDLAIAQLKDFFVNKIVTTFPQILPDNRPNIPDELIAYHLVSAQIGLGIWWIENDQPYPLSYMVEIADWLSFAGGYRALGFDNFELPAPKCPQR